MNPKNHSRAALGYRYAERARRREAARAQVRFLRGMLGSQSYIGEPISGEEATRIRKENAN